MTIESRSRRSPFALVGWVALVAVLAAAAYVSGAMLARRWAEPSLASPDDATPTPPHSAAAWIIPGEPTEGSLGAEAVDEWQFRAQAGQSVTIETWLHPGSGSSVDAELTVMLIAPDGAIEGALAQETGSMFLPPYIFHPSLPSDGSYRLRVEPASGAPGRYSLVVTLAESSGPVTPGVTPLPRATTTAVEVHPAAAAREQFQWPTTRREISGWTFRDPRNPGHIGLDIAAKMWDPIVAIADGTVVFADWGGGYGNLVIVEHADGWRTYYAHFSEIAVETGQQVRQGELLGGAGSTGYSTGSHLHFELRYQGRPVDPHVYLP